MVLINFFVSIKNAGCSHPIPIRIKDAMSDNSIIPIVPGNFKNLRLMYPNIAVRTIMSVMRL